jgi:3-oxoacyl-[acyl-carrier-protein] synthase-3
MRIEDATAVISGIGACLPEHVLDNEQIITAGGLASNDEWIRSRTGIERRHRVAPGISTGDLATAAGAAAIHSAGIRPDFVLLATTTPDHLCPATAPAVAHRLGLGGVPAFDLAAVCSGFLYALITATAMVRAGLCAAPLVIGADTYSTIIDPHDRDTAALFGDGAGAVLLTPGLVGAPGAIRAIDLGSAGDGRELITIPAGGARHPWTGNGDESDSGTGPGAEPASRFFRMQGRAVYREAVGRMTDSSRRALARADWPTHTVRAFIGHQANQRILDSVADRLDIAPRYRFGTIRDTGNTAAASIPLVMADGATQKAMTPGERTVLTAFGGGLTWASVALTWPAAVPRRRPALPEAAPQPVSAPPATT